MGKRQWGTVAGAIVAIAAAVGAGVLVYQHWDSLVSAILSPIGGVVVKVIFGGKVLKILLAVGLAVVAGIVAVKRKLRGSHEPEPGADAAPPVYGPPEPDAGTGTEAALVPPAPDVPRVPEAAQAPPAGRYAGRRVR
jgi:hypothetical protein